VSFKVWYTTNRSAEKHFRKNYSRYDKRFWKHHDSDIQASAITIINVVECVKVCYKLVVKTCVLHLAYVVMKFQFQSEYQQVFFQNRQQQNNI